MIAVKLFVVPLAVLICALSLANTASYNLISFNFDVVVYVAEVLFVSCIFFGQEIALLFAALLFMLTSSWVSARFGVDSRALIASIAMLLLPINAVIFAMLPRTDAFSIGWLYKIVLVLAQAALLVIAAIYMPPAVAFTFTHTLIVALALFALMIIALLFVGLKEGRKNELINLAFACGTYMITLYWHGDQHYAGVFAVASALLLYVSCLPSRENKNLLNFSSLRPRPRLIKPTQKFSIPKEAKTEAKTAAKSVKAKFQSLSFRSLAKPKRPNFSFSLDSFNAFNTLAEPFKPQVYEPLVAHLGCRYDTVISKVTVVLSSAYYWYRRSSVNFTSLRAARKFAPSVFYSWIPEGKYRYFVFKEAEGYGFIACDTNEVRNRLAEQGLDIYLVQRVYFAQSALDSSLSPLVFTEDSALTHIGGAWVVLPAENAEFSSSQVVINPRSPSFRLKQEVSVGGKMSRKRFAFAAALLGIMFVSQLLDFWRISMAISEIENAKEELLLRNKLPPTIMQLDSIEKRLSQIAASQYGLRDNLSRLLVQVQNGHIQMLAYSNSSIKALLRANTPEAAVTLGAALQKLPKTDVVVANDELTVEIRW